MEGDENVGEAGKEPVDISFLLFFIFSPYGAVFLLNDVGIIFLFVYFILIYFFSFLYLD